MGGFEGATHINRHGQRQDMIAGTRHDAMALADYQILKQLGLGGARESVRWHLIEKKPGSYDFTSVEPIAAAAAETDIEVQWTLCHYGYPDGLDILSPDFISRFTDFALHTWRFLRDATKGPLLITPINEISFFTWAGCRDIMNPFAHGRDTEFKQQLVRATLACCRELLRHDDTVRFVFPEPIIHVVPPHDRPELAGNAHAQNESQFEAWEIITGRKYPELGGEERFLRIMGVNFYHANQWEFPSNRLRWEDTPRDPRWKPLWQMLADVSRRFDNRPLFIAETSHFGTGRPRWITEIGAEVLAAIDSGVPIQGICIYPVLDRYDWEDPTHWHSSGLIEVVVADGSYSRVLSPEYLGALQDVQRMFAERGFA